MGGVSGTVSECCKPVTTPGPVGQGKGTVKQMWKSCMAKYLEKKELGE